MMVSAVLFIVQSSMFENFIQNPTKIKIKSNKSGKKRKLYLKKNESIHPPVNQLYWCNIIWTCVSRVIRCWPCRGIWKKKKKLKAWEKELLNKLWSVIKNVIMINVVGCKCQKVTHVHNLFFSCHSVDDGRFM